MKKIFLLFIFYVNLLSAYKLSIQLESSFFSKNYFREYVEEKKLGLGDRHEESMFKEFLEEIINEDLSQKIEKLNLLNPNLGKLLKESDEKIKLNFNFKKESGNHFLIFEKKINITSSFTKMYISYFYENLKSKESVKVLLKKDYLGILKRMNVTIFHEILHFFKLDTWPKSIHNKEKIEYPLFKNQEGLIRLVLNKYQILVTDLTHKTILEIKNIFLKNQLSMSLVDVLNDEALKERKLNRYLLDLNSIKLGQLNAYLEGQLGELALYKWHDYLYYRTFDAVYACHYVMYDDEALESLEEFYSYQQVYQSNIKKFEYYQSMFQYRNCLSCSLAQPRQTQKYLSYKDYMLLLPKDQQNRIESQCEVYSNCKEYGACEAH